MNEQYISKITNKKHGNTEQYIIRDEAAWTEIEKLKKQLGNLQTECDTYKVQPVNSIESITTTSDPTKWQINYTVKGPVAISVPIGVPGEQGAPGTEGRPGEDGKTYVPSYDSVTGELSWKIGDQASEIDPVIIKGEKGDKGDKGDRGPQGITTITGLNIVTSLPDDPDIGDEVLYVGVSGNNLEFGQTYKYKEVFYPAIKLLPQSGEQELRSLIWEGRLIQDFEVFLNAFAQDFNSNSVGTLMITIGTQTTVWDDVLVEDIETAESLVIYSTKTHYDTEQEAISSLNDRQEDIPYLSMECLEYLRQYVDVSRQAVSEIVPQPKYALKTDIN